MGMWGDCDCHSDCLGKLASELNQLNELNTAGAEWRLNADKLCNYALRYVWTLRIVRMLQSFISLPPEQETGETLQRARLATANSGQKLQYR